MFTVYILTNKLGYLKYNAKIFLGVKKYSAYVKIKHKAIRACAKKKKTMAALGKSIAELCKIEENIGNIQRM